MCCSSYCSLAPFSSSVIKIIVSGLVEGNHTIWLLYAVYNHPTAIMHIIAIMSGYVGCIDMQVALTGLLLLFSWAAVVVIGYSGSTVGDSVVVSDNGYGCLWPWASCFLQQLLHLATLLCLLTLVYLISLIFWLHCLVQTGMVLWKF